ncbi:MAG: bifunctional [glutamate--ammonia ligase]-adenylyl-L-tyrosine phosphorylase/[glutamate--ammonia-ligase] adenylyltransferase [Brachymonas sp.]|nr:bifunctional [glutamate--ammonia ligase]-adenylyl-L-tyrosine phosphorylase/[glutamate--ammonia-ligase] adenylyltransferase [Brachymonas sp.]
MGAPQDTSTTHAGTLWDTDALLQPATADYATAIATKAHYCRFVQRLHRRYSDEFALLPPGLPDKKTMHAVLQALQAQGHDTAQGLRILRQLVLERLVVLDCDAHAPLQDVVSTMTQLAELALDTACQTAMQELEQRHGAPRKADGTRIAFWIVGMGKLGARELNVSSDVDLVYLYECDGETAGRPGADGTQPPAGQISAQEFFSRVAKRIYQLIGDVTEHGFVFRIDLELRPNGNSGPVVLSLPALAEYMQVQGREWERFAWMKSRVVAPQAAIRNGSGKLLRAIVLPFVFRRYLDYNVYESLRVLHEQIRSHAATRSAGRPERANDVKLSRGGIREIEFTVQLMQVVRGGQFPELRVRPTLDALQRLARAGLMSAPVAQALAEAYTFLRRVEHRIQYLDDQQTHLLPTSDADMQWLADTMGYPDSSHFLQQLLQHRDIVAREFDALLSGDKPCKHCQSTQNHGTEKAPARDEMGELIAALPAASYPTLAERLQGWREHSKIAALRPQARTRLLRLLQRSLAWLAQSGLEAAHAETGVLRQMDWLETVLRRESYLALLTEHPAAHARLLQMLAQARWTASYLIRNPGVVDELVHSHVLEERFNPDAFLQSLEQRLRALQSTGEDDDEALLNLLRRAKHAETFRTLARDLAGRLTVEQVADDLSALADAVLETAVRWCWQRLQPKVQALGMTDLLQQDLAEHFAIIAYGKLGGLELGYGSDLDLVFLYANDHPRAGELYAALVRKLIVWLTTKTGEGDLYEIDTALRPNGNAGLLTTPLDAFEAYQLQRGSNTAWVWEHQAMTRARCCFGSPALRQQFDAIRTAVISAPRDAESLRAEILAMRQRVSQAHKVPDGQFDLKHSAGGMVDAEFVTQYLVLLHSGAHPRLLQNRGNIALLEWADDLAILPADQQTGHAAASAYRELRRRQHHARLNEESGMVPMEQVQHEAQAIQHLWQTVFGE